MLTFTPDGIPFSPDYRDVYHSADGGPGQARHVFLAGNGLPGRWGGRARFVILETGFGTGLNFLATWTAWRDDPARPAQLHYLALEKHPFTIPELAALHARWPEFQPLAEALRRAWPSLTPGYHRLAFEGGRVVLTLMLGEAQDCLRRLDARVDAGYLDGFDPRRNPAMWSPELMRRLARLAAPDATLATWCVAGAVRDALRQAGFATEKRPGYGRKREMLTGRLATPAIAPAGAGPAARALVLGAGIAGCAIAERLASRGWAVTLIERHPAPACEASGNRAGIVRPMVSRDDNLASRLNRACFLYAGRAWAALETSAAPPRYRLNGVLQLARDPAHETLQQALAAGGGYPDDYLRHLDRAEAGRLLGGTTPRGGWFFPRGGWADPASLCRAWLASGGPRIHARFGQAAGGIERAGADWRVLDAAGRPIAAAPVLILAGGALAPRWRETAGLPIRPVRGQVSHIPAGRLPPLEVAACCEGYLTPALDGIHCLGASYAHDTGDELRPDEHADNLKRLARILPGAGSGLDPAQLAGRVGFRAATPDRLPMVGALPDLDAPLPRGARLKDLPRLPGLYGLMGLGSRGLVWATLAAETLASRLSGEPMPLETDLVDAMDPGRFYLRRVRRG